MPRPQCQGETVGLQTDGVQVQQLHRVVPQQHMGIADGGVGDGESPVHGFTFGGIHRGGVLECQCQVQAARHQVVDAGRLPQQVHLVVQSEFL